jgi:hypothetical protein
MCAHFVLLPLVQIGKAAPAAATPAVAVAQAPAAATKSEWRLSSCLMAVCGVVEGEALPPECVKASGL